MVSFDKWIEEVGNDKIQNIIEVIEDLSLPPSVEGRLLNVILDSEAYILEDMYEGFISDYEDRAYEEYKESLWK